MFKTYNKDTVNFVQKQNCHIWYIIFIILFLQGTKHTVYWLSQTYFLFIVNTFNIALVLSSREISM